MPARGLETFLTNSLRVMAAGTTSKLAMKPQLLLTFAAGLLLGWLGALAWQGETPDGPAALRADSRPEPGPGKRVSGEAADAITAARRRGEATRGALAPLHAARLAEALRQPVPDKPSDASAASTADQRFTRWLEGSGLPTDLRAEIAAAYAREKAAGGSVDPLQAGSPFDQWLRERLTAATAATWDALRDEQRNDVVERRANRLLVGLQDTMALTNEQKDAIYPKLAEWVRAEMDQPITEGQSKSEAREEWLASRYSDLSAMLPADQHDAIADWLTEFLPEYWLAEDTAR